MSQSTEYLQATPSNALSFPYIPKRYITSSIHLSNTSDLPVAFKIKTNAPFSYLVKPKIGFILPKRSLQVDITMQPCDLDSHSVPTNDKFLINAYPIKIPMQGLSYSAGQLKEVFDKTPNSLVQNFKIKAVIKGDFNRDSTSEGHLDDTREHSGIIENSPNKESLVLGRSSISKEGGSMNELRTSNESLEHKLGNILPEKGGLSPAVKQISEGNVSDGSFFSSLESNKLPLKGEFSHLGLHKSQSLLEKKSNEIVEHARMLGNIKMSSESNLPKLLNEKPKDDWSVVAEHKQFMSHALEDKLKAKINNLKHKEKEEIFKVKEMVVNSIEKIHKGEINLWQIMVIAIFFLILGAVVKFN